MGTKISESYLSSTNDRPMNKVLNKDEAQSRNTDISRSNIVWFSLEGVPDNAFFGTFYLQF